MVKDEAASASDVAYDTNDCLPASKLLSITLGNSSPVGSKFSVVMYNAKTMKVYDPINNSIGIYLDSINIFVRFVQILGNSKKK